MNPQGPIVAMIPYYNRVNNCKIFDLASRPSYLSYRGSEWHGTMKSESENLRGNKIFENAERENNSEAEKFGHKNPVIWNQKDPDLIHVDTNYTNSNQPLPDDLINIGPIHDAYISEKEEILLLSVHLVHPPPPVPASPIFLYGRASDPPPPSNDS